MNECREMHSKTDSQESELDRICNYDLQDGAPNPWSLALSSIQSSALEYFLALSRSNDSSTLPTLQLTESGTPIDFNPLSEFARSVWTKPINLDRTDRENERIVDERTILVDQGNVVPIDFEDKCNPISGSTELPELNLDCFRLHAFEQENANLANLADFTIKSVPDILAETIKTSRAFGDIPLMLLSGNTANRLQDAILADENIQKQSPWPTDSLSLVDLLNPQAAYESLHGEEQRVWDYLEREGLHPFLKMGEDGGARITVRLFD